ncbi:MAG: hypothetical protein N2039_05115 [Gemmataceae bacterium]|nr:hypothetical protein [Gemmataceae bacterium]
MGKQPRPGRSPLSDIERFLREVEQLRKKAAEEQAKAEPPIDEVEVVRPPRSARRPPPPRPVIVELPPRPKAPEPDVVDVIPARPPTTTQFDLPAAVSSGPASIAAMPPSMAPSAMPAPPRPRPASAPATVDSSRPNLGQRLVQMLRSPETVPLAIVLTEVLGPPRCRSRRR